MTITVAITAKNEAETIAANLRSIQIAIREAEAQLSVNYELVVVLNDSTDATESQIPADVSVLKTSGGLVEAQRAVADRPPFVIFSDADIIVGPTAIAEVTEAMLAAPNLQVAYPQKKPLRPQRRTVLAEALHTYNCNDGFETKRSYFNGKLFAIRNWRIPTKEELPRLPEVDRFLDLDAGVLADDIYLSKSILAEGGVDAIRETTGSIWYRAPETFDGMYRYYRRMRMELARVARLFPDLRWPQGPPPGWQSWRRRATLAPWGIFGAPCSRPQSCCPA